MPRGSPPLRIHHGYAAKNNIEFANVNRSQLIRGIKVEMEHTDDLLTAATIALDHLAEIPNYYTLLERMEQKHKRFPRL